MNNVIQNQTLKFGKFHTLIPTLSKHGQRRRSKTIYTFIFSIKKQCTPDYVYRI